ncbi:fimbrial protein [Burkholderia territorii]|nr:fimbrial protein [Burkholderia territorii]
MKLKQFKKMLVAAAFALWLPAGAAYAAVCIATVSNSVLSLGSQSISGPSSGYPPGSAIGSFITSASFLTVGIANGQPCPPSDNQYRVTLNPVSPLVPGVQYVENGVAYPVYETTIPGIGYAVAVIDGLVGGDWKPLTANLDLGVRNRYVSSSIKIRAVLVVTGPVKSGTYSFSSYWFALRGIGTTSGAEMINLTTGLGSISAKVTVAARVCKVVDGADTVVNLPPVTATSFNGVGSVSSQAAERFAITLDCQEDIRLHATMTDASDPSNTTDILTLAPGSTASGVGIRILRDNGSTPVSYGPDSSSIGNPNQWYITTTPLNGARVAVPFVAKYAQSGAKVSSGSVMARSTITFSYQ